MLTLHKPICRENTPTGLRKAQVNCLCDYKAMKVDTKTQLIILNRQNNRAITHTV